MSKLTPFDFLNAINVTKEDLLEKDPQNVKDYNAFMVNKGLSYFADTVMQANEMNRLYDAPKKWQFQYLLNSIAKKKRFSKWHKADVSKSLSLVMEYYGYSSEKATVALGLLTEDQLKNIEERLNKGGKS
jgi:hypothetical protein